MFESKNPITKKPKLSIKSDTSDLGSQAKLDTQVISQDRLGEEGHKSGVSMELEIKENVSKSNDERIHVNEKMNSENVDKNKPSTKLCLTKNKIQLEDLELVCSQEKADTDLRLQEDTNLNKIDDVSNQNIVYHPHNSPFMPNNWNLKQLKYSGVNTSPQSLNLGKYN